MESRGIAFETFYKNLFMADEKNTPQVPDITEAHESDAEKIVHKHLADPNHKITDEELAGIRVGVVSEADEPTKQAVGESGERIADAKADNEDETTPGAQKSTPWDVISG